MFSKNDKNRIVILFLLVVGVAANCQGTIQQKITQIISRKDQANVKYGILVIEANSGRTVFNFNENLPLTPASNMKLITSFAALKLLGPKFEYVTTAGLIDKKLVIIGSGDPLLGLSGNGNNFIEEIVKALKDRNITELEEIIIDSSIFADERVHPSWPKDQLNRPYACEISGLNYNGNCVKISATRVNGAVELVVEPNTACLTVVNKVQPIDKGQSAIGAYRTDKENVIIVSGKCKKAASFDVAIEKPEMFFACLLIESLNRQGIKTPNNFVTAAVNTSNLQMIVQNQTAIMDVLKHCNKDSFQLAAESLLKTIGAKESNGRAGSWQKGQQVLTNYLESLGADMGCFYIDDGSGLSSRNKLSAAVIVKVISDAYSSELWTVFRESLAIGGVDGTLKKYFYQDRYRGRIFAKTGYLNNVRALSGVCKTQSGEYIFSILSNNTNYKTKEAILDIVKAIIDEG